MQELTVPVEYLPCWQTVQALDSVPVAELERYLPPPQLVHALEPAPLYFPVAQPLQESDVAELHVPAPQLSQAVFQLLAFFPAAHELQLPAFAFLCSGFGKVVES